MRLSGQNGSKLAKPKESGSEVAAVVLVIVVGLAAFLVWGAIKESRKMVRQLGLWAASVERMRQIRRYIYLFALGLLIARMFKGIWGVLKVLGAILLLPGMLVSEKIKEYFKKRTLEALDGDDQLIKGTDR